HGDSGCGKSSLVRAGVMPRLEGDRAHSGATWRTASMLPRRMPLENLANALAALECGAPDPSRATQLRRMLYLGAKAGPVLARELRCDKQACVCVLVDQFEELFELASRGGVDEARQFVKVLVGLQQRPQPGLHVVLTTRTEFTGPFARFEGLAEAFN